MGIIMTSKTTIELEKTTLAKLTKISGMSESFDDVIIRLLEEDLEIDDFINKYVEDKHGECVNENILGRNIIANHRFVGDVCVKCGVAAPIVIGDDGIICLTERTPIPLPPTPASLPRD